jgi:hypothetical protein
MIARREATAAQPAQVNQLPARARKDPPVSVGLRRTRTAEASAGKNVPPGPEGKAATKASAEAARPALVALTKAEMLGQKDRTGRTIAVVRGAVKAVVKAGANDLLALEHAAPMVLRAPTKPQKADQSAAVPEKKVPAQKNRGSAKAGTSARSRLATLSPAVRSAGESAAIDSAYRTPPTKGWSA